LANNKTNNIAFFGKANNTPIIGPFLMSKIIANNPIIGLGTVG
jgi:hypothetical protein